MGNEGKRQFAVWVEAISTREERFHGALLRLGVPPEEIARVVREAPCQFRGQLTLVDAEELKVALRDAGARVFVRIDQGRITPGPMRVAVGTSPPPEPTPRMTTPLPEIELPPLAADLPQALELEEPAGPPALPLRDPTVADPDAPEVIGDLELDEQPVLFNRGTGRMPMVIAEAAVAAPAAVPEVVAPAPVVVSRRSRVGTLAPPAVPAAPPTSAKPPAVWQPMDLSWMRTPARVAAGLALLLLTHCVARYQVDDRLHTFSETTDENLEQELAKLSRDEHRPANATDIQAVAERVGARAGVKLKLHSVVEIRMIGVTDMMGCRRGKPERNPGFPVEFHVRLNLRNTACEAPAWVVGFRAEITTRTLWVKSTKYVEHFAFADNYVGQNGATAGEWLDAQDLVERIDEQQKRMKEEQDRMEKEMMESL